MKKVIIPTAPENSITLETVLEKDNPIVAFQLPTDKVVLIRTGYKTTLYKARCLEGWERGNHYNPNNVTDETIQAWVEFFEKHHGAETFAFDSPQELFRWLAE